MRWLEQLRMRLQMLLHRSREAKRLDAELQYHLEQQIAENTASGMSPEEARHAALRLFGNPAVLREQARETWRWNWLDQILRDVRLGIRTLTRTPGFACVVILIIAIGVGANVALFTIVRSVLLKPLPLPDPDRLVRIFESDSHYRSHDITVAGGDFAEWQQQSKSFTQMAIYYNPDEYTMSAGGELPERIHGQVASWNIFKTLGVTPARGRLFVPDDDRIGAEGAVVISWGFWKRRFGGDPAVIGKKLLLDARPYAIIGILPQWFTWPDAKIQAWTTVYHELPPNFVQVMQSHDSHNFEVIARLKPGVTIDTAAAEIGVIQAQIRKRFPEGPVFDAANVHSALTVQTHEFSTGLYTLLAATGCVLFIACLNVANLLVARAAVCKREFAIRTALGGSRLRLLREQLTEILLLSCVGGLLGVLFAYGAIQWTIHVRTDLPRSEAIHLDGMVLAFTAGITVLFGLIAGVIQSLSMHDKHVSCVLQESSRAASSGNPRVRLRRLLLMLQVSFTVVLLISAGLLLKSYRQLRSVDVGCNTRGVLTMSINLPLAEYKTPVQTVSFLNDLEERLHRLHGVGAVAVGTMMPGEGHGSDDAFGVPELPPLPKGQFMDASVRWVDPAFFSALQIPVLRGRVFAENERLERHHYAIVNQAFVRQFFPNADPIGKHILDDNNDAPNIHGQPNEIIGVVGDTRETVYWTAANPTIYYPLYGGLQNSLMLAVRTNGNPDDIALPVQKVVAQINPNLSVGDVLPMDQAIGKYTLDASFDATLVTAFAVLSLVLAAIGLYGVLSYLVTQRTTEVGIRIALGAQRDQVLALMLGDGLRPALLGLVVGLITSAGVMRWIRSMLYGTEPLDIGVFLGMSFVLLFVAWLACLIPAWRASRLDPMAALRTE